jgi:hypothetical protein
MGDRFREGEASLDLVEGLLLLIGVALIGLVMWLLHRTFGPGRDRSANSPWSLFHRLCRAHRLQLSQRRVLRSLARYHQLHHPARMFVDPSLFATALADEQCPVPRDRLQAVYQRLFG